MRRAWRAVVAAACVAVAVLTAFGIGRWAWLDQIDAAAIRAAPEFPPRIPFLLARTVFEVGDARVLAWAGLGLGLLVAWRRRRTYPLMVYLLVLVVHFGIVEGTKWWAGRGRPDTGQPLLRGVAGGASFPSGHSASAVVFFAMAGVFLAALTGDRRWDRRLAIVAAVATTVCAASIFYLGYHWVTDVVAGAAIGIAEWVLLAPLVRRWLRLS